MAGAAKVTYEDWTANINWLCKACSEGLPHANHDHEGDPTWRSTHHFGFSAPVPAVSEIVDVWLHSGVGRQATEMRLF
jgi:hypothetical protein